MTDSVERLQELLDIKDEQLYQRDDTIRKLKYQLEFGADWMLHQYKQKEDEVLPVPRLHLQQTQNAPQHEEFRLSLVMGGFGSQVTYVPLSYSKRSGNMGLLDRISAKGELTDQEVSAMPNLVIDGAIQMEAMQLPFYVQLDEKRIYKVSSGRPLKMRAI